MAKKEDNEDKWQVESDLYVNEATLELLQRRLESDVKSNFFRWVGLPVGSAGLGAILFFLFVWGPQTIENYVAEDPEMQKQLQQTVVETTEAYLKDTDTGQQVVREHVGTSTLNYLTDDESGQKAVRDMVRQVALQNLQKQVTTYFESGEGQKLLARQVAGEMEDYFATEKGRENLTQAVQKGLQSDQVRTLITQTISRAIQPFADSVRQSLSKHKDDVLTELLRAEVRRDPEGYDVVELPGMTAERVSLAQFGKGSVSELYRFLSSPEAEKIAESGRPLALTFHLQSGARYAAGAIETYVDEMKGHFGDQFAYCLILQGEKDRFVALVDVRQLVDVLSSDRREDFMELLNASADQVRPEDARRKVATLLGAVREPIELRPELTIWEAIRSPAWMSLPLRDEKAELQEGLPVVDTTGSFEGVLTRGHLISRLLAG
ncbi:MAG: hypothetical protein V5A84_00990 [Planctomycetota bacterium]